MIRHLRPFDPHRIRLLIFDLDGTLVDSRLDLIHSVTPPCRHIGRPELDGDNHRQLCRRRRSHAHPARARPKNPTKRSCAKALDFFLAYYRQHKLDHTTVL